MKYQLLIAFFLGILLCEGLFAAETPWRTGAKFQSELNAAFSATWRNVELREVLQRIGQDRQIAILLDRRVDPNATWTVEFTQPSLRGDFAELARKFHGDVSEAENVVYLGPIDSCRKLRTLIALRSEELSSSESRISKDRQQRWRKPRSVTWSDLDSPREILHRLAQELDVTLKNPSRIEHDLWAGAVLPEVTGVEAISLILIQFHLTFQWQDHGAAIELVSIPESVRISRTYKFRGTSSEKTLTDWKASWPDAEFQLVKGGIVVQATVEEHEEIAAIRMERTKNRPTETQQPLNRQKFALKVRDVSARDVMTELEKSEITFEFDEEQLKGAGIDLNTFVEFDVQSVSAEELLHALFDPLDVAFVMNGSKVTLSPKP